MSVNYFLCKYSSYEVTKRKRTPDKQEVKTDNKRKEMLGEKS